MPELVRTEAGMCIRLMDGLIHVIKYISVRNSTWFQCDQITGLPFVDPRYVHDTPTCLECIARGVWWRD